MRLHPGATSSTTLRDDRLRRSPTPATATDLLGDRRRPGGRTCATAPTSSRRSPGCDGYDDDPVRAAAGARPGAGLTHGQRVRRVGRPTRWPGTGLRRGADLPVRRRRACTTRSACAADDPRRSALRLANPLSEEQPLMRTSPARHAWSRPLRRNVARGSADVALFEIGLVTRPERRRAWPAPPGTSARPDDETLAAMLDAVPPPAAPGRRSPLAGDARAAPAGGAPGRPADWSDAVDGRTRRRRRRSAVALDGQRGRRTPPGTPAAAPGSRWPTARSSGTPASCTPRCVAALGLPARTCAAELDLDVLSRGRRRGPCAAGRSVDLPGGPGATSRSSSTTDVPAAAVRGRPARGRRRAAGVAVAVRRLHRRRRWATGTESLAYRAAPSARPTAR